MIKPEECPESASSWWEASQGLPSMTRNDDKDDDDGDYSDDCDVDGDDWDGNGDGDGDGTFDNVTDDVTFK